MWIHLHEPVAFKEVWKVTPSSPPPIIPLQMGSEEERWRSETSKRERKKVRRHLDLCPQSGLVSSLVWPRVLASLDSCPH